jgi:hypothetical protein
VSPGLPLRRRCIIGLRGTVRPGLLDVFETQQHLFLGQPTRIVTPSISTSIIPAPGSALHGGALRWRRTVDADEATSTTAGTNCNLSASEDSAWDSRN